MHLVDVVLGEVLEDDGHVEVLLDGRPVQLHVALGGQALGLQLVDLAVGDQVDLVLDKHHGDVAALVLHLRQSRFTLKTQTSVD